MVSRDCIYESNLQCSLPSCAMIMLKPYVLNSDDPGFERGWYSHPADRISIHLGVASGWNYRYRFRNFESELYVLVKFIPCKSRYGGTVRSDRVTSWSGFRPVGVVRRPNSDRRHVECVIRVEGGWPITDVVPTVQPEYGDSQISNLR